MRPLVVLDTSIFVADAYSRTQRGGASTVLALGSAGVIDIVLCEEIRAELREVFEEDGLDPRSIVSANTRHFRPGPNYAGFQFVTARELIDKLSR